MTVKMRYEFPELLHWNLCDSISLGNLAIDIIGHIQSDIKTADRVLTPGLRLCLNLIAEKTGLTN